MPHQPEPMFGRQGDLQWLQKRIKTPGITILAARPQQGKTRLLEALRDGLRNPPTAERQHHVGYYEGTSAVSDLILRALEELYTQFVAESSYRQQAQLIAEQQKSRWTQGLFATGTTLGHLLSIFDPTKASTEAVKSFFSGLNKANDDLKSGGINLLPLAHEQVRDVLQVIYDISGKPSVLILDAFEQLSDPVQQAGNLHHFLTRHEHWPPVHIILACREPAQGERENATFKEMQLLCAESALANIRRLGAMDLKSLEEHDRVLVYIRDLLPGTTTIADYVILDLLNGYPGTLKRWRESATKTLEGMKRAAADAEDLQYREIKPILERLYRENRMLFNIAARICLLPEAAYGGERDLFHEVVLARESNDALDALVDCGLLERSLETQLCSLGLTARYECTRRFFLEHPTWANAKSEATEKLLMELASRVQSNDTMGRQFLSAIISLRQNGAAFLNAPAKSFLQLTAYGLSSSPLINGNDLDLVSVHTFVAECPDAASLASMMMLNALNTAKAENATDRLDIILKESRILARRYPGNSEVQKQFASGLLNAMNHAREEQDLRRHDELLTELRALSEHFPAHPLIRERLAMGLANAVFGATESKEYSKSDELLNQLRQLALDFPENDLINACFSNGIVIIIRHNLINQDVHLEELRSLCKKKVDNDRLQESFAQALHLSIAAASHANDVQRRDSLLDEMRELSSRYRRNHLMQSLVSSDIANAVNYAAAENKLDRRATLIQQLQSLAEQFYDLPQVRKSLAVTLYNAVCFAKRRGDLSERDIRLDELRDLSSQFAADPAIQKELAKSLFNTINDTTREFDLPRRDKLVKEFGIAASISTDNVEVQELWATALRNVIWQTVLENNLTLRELHMEELRRLATQFCENVNINKVFANVLINDLIKINEQKDSILAEKQRNEIDLVSTRFPDDISMQYFSGPNLMMLIFDAHNKGNIERRDGFLRELQRVSLELFAMVCGRVNNPIANFVFSSMGDAGLVDGQQDRPFSGKILGGGPEPAEGN